MPYADIFESRDGLRRYLLASLLFHASLTGMIWLWHWRQMRPRDAFGDPKAIPGATVVTPVGTIPMITRPGPANPVANETESRVPSAPKPESRRQEAEQEDAVPLLRREKKQPKKAEARQRYQVQKQFEPNQVFSSTGAAATSRLYGVTSSGSGVGVGAGNPFGTRFGWYGQLIIQRIAEKWQTQHLDPQLQSAPVVIVGFQIQRDGSIRDVRLMQRSGNYALDVSAQRAVLEAAPFPPLPDGFDRNWATVEIQFQFKR